MKTTLFLEVLPFALLVAFFWYAIEANDKMAISCLAAIIVVVLVQLAPNLRKL